MVHVRDLLFSNEFAEEYIFLFLWILVGLVFFGSWLNVFCCILKDLEDDFPVPSRWFLSGVILVLERTWKLDIVGLEWSLEGFWFQLIMAFVSANVLCNIIHNLSDIGPDGVTVDSKIAQNSRLCLSF